MLNENEKNEIVSKNKTEHKIEQLDLVNLESPTDNDHKLGTKVNQIIERENSHESRIKKLEASQPIDAGSDKSLNKVIKKRIFNLIGGVDSNAYRSNYYKKVSHDLRQSMYDYFDVASTKDLNQSQLAKANDFVDNWQLDIGTKMKIDELNTSERVPTKHAFKFDDAGRERMEKFIAQPDEAFERLERLLALPAEQFDQILDNFSKNYDEYSTEETDDLDNSFLDIFFTGTTDDPNGNDSKD